MHQLMHQDRKLGVPQPPSRIHKLPVLSSPRHDRTIFLAGKIPLLLPELRTYDHGALEGQTGGVRGFPPGRRAHHAIDLLVDAGSEGGAGAFEDGRLCCCSGREVLAAGDGLEDLFGEAEVGVGFEEGGEAVGGAGAFVEVGEDVVEGVTEAVKQVVEVGGVVDVLAVIDDVISAGGCVAGYGGG